MRPGQQSRSTREGRRAPRVVVGFDGSAPAEAAVAWAATRAGRWRGDLHVVTAAFYPTYLSHTGDRVPGVSERLASAVEVTRDQGAKIAARYLDTSRISSRVSHDSAAGALTRASEHAAEVVVGHRGRGPVRAALLGSVSIATVTHARSTVVVVRARPSLPGPEGQVVVGVDGSQPSQAAVGYAADFAAGHGAPLQVVAAWREPEVAGWGAAQYWEAHVLADWEQAMSARAQTVAAAAAETARAAHPDLVVTTHVASQSPVQALVAASETSALVVVGARGLGGFRQLLLGSVSRGVVQQAKGTVAVAR